MENNTYRRDNSCLFIARRTSWKAYISISNLVIIIFINVRSHPTLICRLRNNYFIHFVDLINIKTISVSFCILLLADTFSLLNNTNNFYIVPNLKLHVFFLNPIYTKITSQIILELNNNCIK